MTDNELRLRIQTQIMKLSNARDAASDPAAKAELLEQIEALEMIRSQINVAAADEFAERVGGLVDALNAVRTKHKLDAVSALADAIDGLVDIESDLLGEIRLPAARESAEPSVATAAAVTVAAVGTVASTAAAAAVALAGVFKTRKDKQFSLLESEYFDLFDRCRVRDARSAEVKRMADRIKTNETRYRAVGDPLGIPWPFVGVVHAMESSLSFKTHLHNGDPLTARTRQVPAGRPAMGMPPFTWEESATDALKLKKLDQNTDWSTPRMLFLLESFNGFGYRPRELPTPYLWSFSNIYEKGKFVADGRFDPEAVSKQCGAAVLLQALH